MIDSNGKVWPKSKKSFLGGLNNLKTYTNINGTDINFGISNNDAVIKLKMLLVGKLKYKRLNSIVGINKVKINRIEISLAIEKEFFMLIKKKPENVLDCKIE